METTLLIAALVAVFSWAATKEEIFKDLRVSYFEPGCKNPKLPYLVRKVCYMLTCEYCFSFWFTLLAVLFFHHKISYGDYPSYHDYRNYVLAHGVTWAIAVLFMSIYQRVRVDIRHEQAVTNNEEKKNERS